MDWDRIRFLIQDQFGLKYRVLWMSDPLGCTRDKVCEVLQSRMTLDATLDHIETLEAPATDPPADEAAAGPTPTTFRLEIANVSDGFPARVVVDKSESTGSGPGIHFNFDQTRPMAIDAFVFQGSLAEILTES